MGSYFKYRKRLVCALEPGCWLPDVDGSAGRLGAGAAADVRCFWQCALVEAWCRCRVLLADVDGRVCFWPLGAGAAAGCRCWMSMAVFALEAACWCHCRCRC